MNSTAVEGGNHAQDSGIMLKLNIDLAARAFSASCWQGHDGLGHRGQASSFLQQTVCWVLGVVVTTTAVLHDLLNSPCGSQLAGADRHAPKAKLSKLGLSPVCCRVLGKHAMVAAIS